MKAHVFGRLIITTCNQAGAAPLLDHVTCTAEDGRMFFGRMLLLTPWKRNQYGESLPQRALVVGWHSKTPVWWARWKPKKPVRSGPPSRSTIGGKSNVV